MAAESEPELTEVLRAIRDRVRSRRPAGVAQVGAAPVPLADLMPIVHARDAALGKVAAIGKVNPRAGGPLNALVQSVKRAVSRALDWHVREQTEFNRQAVACVDATIEALNEFNRALIAAGAALDERDAALRAEMQRHAEFLHAEGERLHGSLAGLRRELPPVRAEAERLKEEARQLADIRKHWSEWRMGWEHKLAHNEMQFLRSVADLQAGFSHRVSLMEANFRDNLKGQHADYEGALARTASELQQRMWSDLERVRIEYERLIHEELRVIRQRVSPAAPAPAPSPAPAAPEATDALPFDYARFAERFRGGFAYVQQNQRVYLPRFASRRRVADLGCGRGEFLELLRDAEVPAIGIDSSEETIALCRQRGLDVECADLFAWLAAQPEASFDGIFCAQVVEHLPPARLPEFVKLAASRLERGGVIVIETPNPECLAIFATHFYLDPTHQRPVPHQLLMFYLEEFGVGGLEVERLAPAVESMPSLASLPGDVREAFFGALDYAVIGTRL